MYCMGTAINNNLSSDLQSLLRNQLQAAAVEKQPTNTNAAGVGPTSGTQSDQSYVSPFSQIVSTLQTLQQSNPAEYGQITRQIATELQKAATSADPQNSNSLVQLAKAFQDASQSGQLPQLQAASASSGFYSRIVGGADARIVGGADASSRIVGGADARIVGGADANSRIVGGADARIVGGADASARIVGGADANIVGGADSIAVILSALHNAGLVNNS